MWCCLSLAIVRVIPATYLHPSRHQKACAHHGRFWRNEKGNSRCSPHYRRMHGSIIGRRVELRLIVAVEAHLRAFAPQNAAVQVRARDAEERQVRDCEREFNEDERPQHAVEPPLLRDEDAARHCDDRGWDGAWEAVTSAQLSRAGKDEACDAMRCARRRWQRRARSCSVDAAAGVSQAMCCRWRCGVRRVQSSGSCN